MPGFFCNTFVGSITNLVYHVRIPNKEPERFYTWPDENGKITDHITVYGTTFSGNPLRTTLGNSIRVLTYLRVYAKYAGVPIKAWVAGDDALISVPRYEASKLVNTILAMSYREVPENKGDPVLMETT